MEDPMRTAAPENDGRGRAGCWTPSARHLNEDVGLALLARVAAFS